MTDFSCVADSQCNVGECGTSENNNVSELYLVKGVCQCPFLYSGTQCNTYWPSLDGWLDAFWGTIFLLLFVVIT